MHAHLLTYFCRLSWIVFAGCLFAAPIPAAGQPLASDYAAIGLGFSVPDTWQHDGLQTTTKAAFIKQFGWVYDKPDKDAIWNAVGRFSSIQVDSMRLPAAEAYTMHNLTIFVNRANTLYKQWLCRQHRLNLFQTKPLVKEDARLILQHKLAPVDMPAGLSRAHGQSYQYQSFQAELTTIGHVFAFVHQARCFEVKIESTAAAIDSQSALHQHILNTFELIPF
ncbi:MAG: hypothetical protein AAF564_13375 [Bacteroidota bacterium]